MNLAIVVAMDKKRAIGKNNALPWHLPADLQHFKEVTMGKPIIMGRKTYESIGRPLPGRKNIVISSQRNYSADGCVVVHSFDEALQIVADSEQAMIIGGANLFKQAMDKVNEMYLTIIDAEFEADTFFPQWHEKEWRMISTEKHQPDEKNKYSYCFIHLARV